jgi:hypothetical protein
MIGELSLSAVRCGHELTAYDIDRGTLPKKRSEASPIDD